MSQLESTGPSHGLVTAAEVKLGGLAPKKTGALKIVVGDFERSVNWLATKQWALRWKESQERYEPLRITDTWEGTDIPRSSVNVYTVAQIVESIMAKVMEGVFSDDPPFLVTNRPKTTAECARAWSTLLHYQTEDCGFRQEIEDGASDAVLFGTNIWKVNWEEIKRRTKTYKRVEAPAELPSPAPGVDGQQIHTKKSDDVEPVVAVKTNGRPIIESQDLHMTFVNPGLRVPDIRKAKYVITKANISIDELDNMRDWEGYTIPPRAALLAMAAARSEHAETTTLESMQTNGGASDHQAEPRHKEDTSDITADDSMFEILERWDKNKVMVVLNRTLVIRNEEHGLSSIPYFSVGFKRVPNAFYSIGVGILTGDEQEIQRGLINALLDEVSFNLNLPYLTVKGTNTLTQNIRSYMGKIVPVEDPSKIKPMERLQAVPEAYQNIQASEARAEASSGANEQMVQGATPAQGRTSLGRTATGANLLAGGSGSRLEAFVSRLAEQVIIPALNMFVELDKDLLDPEQIRDILSDEMETAWNEDHIELLNARIKVDILAAAKMVARQRMAQSLPMLAQALLTDPIHTMLQAAGKKLDINELVNMWFDISGWRNKADLIVDMTKEDEQRAQMQNPGVQRSMAEKTKAQAETQGQLQVQDAKDSAGTFRDLLRHGANADESAADRSSEIITPEVQGRAMREVERAQLQKALTPQQASGEPAVNPQQFGG